MSALSIVSKACSRLGIAAPTAVFSSTDDQIIQLRNLMNEEGEQLAKAHAWTRLTNEKTFTTTAAAIQAGAVPTDFNWFLNDTLWNRTTRIKLTGPVSPEDWQAYQSLSIISLPAAVFRFRGGDLLIYPSPTAGQTAAYEYGSTYWVSGSKTAFDADSDTALLDEALITLGVRWRFLAAKGMDYAETFRTYELEKAKAIGRDGGRRKYYLGGTTVSPFQGNIPEGGWPH